MKNTLFILFYFFTLYLSAQEPSFRVIGKEELSGYDIYDIVQNNNGVVILGTNNGVYKYDGVNISKLKSPKLKDKSFFGFKTDNQNNIFCYNLIGEIYRVTEDSLTHYTTIPEDYLTDYFSFEFTDKNEIVFSFIKPIIRNADGKYSMLFEKHALEYFENTIHKMNDGRIILFNATKNIVYIYEGDGQWDHIQIEEDIPFHHKISIESDKEYIYILDHNTYKVYKVKDHYYDIIQLDYQQPISFFINDLFNLISLS